MKNESNAFRFEVAMVRHTVSACSTVFLATRSVTVTRNLILLADDTVDTVSLTLYGDWDLVTESD